MQPAVRDARASRAAAIAAIDTALRPSTPITKPKLQPKQAAGVRPANKKVPDPIRPETIERLFEGGTAVLFATGPSLTENVVDEVIEARQRRKLYLFGCNDAYKLLPTLDVHYACDSAWWRIHYKDLHDYPLTAGMWTQEPRLSKTEYPLLRRISGRSGNGLSTDQSQIIFGNNSGYQLINLAFLFGIKNFILCGYNMSVHNGKRHFFGDHPQGLNRSGNYLGFVKNYDTIKPQAYGIDIVNATPKSSLTAFRKMPLGDALKLWL